MKSSAFCLVLALVFSASIWAQPPVEAITFAAEPGVIYAPLLEVARHLHLDTTFDKDGRCVQLQSSTVKPGSLRQFTDGTELLRAIDLPLADARITLEEKDGVTLVRRGFYRLRLLIGPKRVEVNLAAQQLEAWQGSRLVLKRHISSGRHGSTPTGSFTAGPFRARMHYSSLFQNAPMPWSVQIYGHVFIHGFTSVPDHPASHGCIRLPLDGGNPARFFYEWVDDGTPVRVLPGDTPA
ncbi:L,D-transpeptidase family protein [Prosthecobacter sp.]|uniref:L,D-transpeptidase family protein n=1 Tax=Prosthecobacter sp. TaxID=1965333 RepID=UPI003783DB85